MRLGVNTLFYIPGEVGGTETYLRCLLPRIIRRLDGDEVVIFTNRENDRTLRNDLSGLDAVAFEHLSFSAMNRYARIVREQTELTWRANRAKLDVLWSPGYTLPVFARAHQVVTIHDMQYKTHPEDLGALARLTTDILVRLAARRARRILTPSFFAAKEVVKHTAADDDKLRPVLSGVDPAFGEPVDGKTQDEVRQRVGDTRYVLAVANSYPHKNLPTLVRAYGLAAPNIPQSLVIVGRDRLGESNLRQELAALPDAVGSRVVRLAGVSADELRGLYQAADLFVFPSVYEGFGLPILEAMMAGTPVVTTRHASIPEVGGEYAHYVENGYDPNELAGLMVRVLGDDSEASQRNVVEAKCWATAMTWDKSATSILNVLRIAAQ